MGTFTAPGREKDLLREIGAIADRLRDLRRTDPIANQTQVRVLTSDLQARWSEIRALRAAPTDGDVMFRSHRGSYS